MNMRDYPILHLEVYVDHSRLWLSCLGPLVFLLPTTLNYLTFKYFDLQRTR